MKFNRLLYLVSAKYRQEVATRLAEQEAEQEKFWDMVFAEAKEAGVTVWDCR